MEAGKKNWAQYFKLTVSAPLIEDKKQTGKDVEYDLTPYVDEGCSFMDEDGMLQELRFDLASGELWVDVLAPGMRIDFFGGYYDDYEYLFSGYIDRIEPEFTEAGLVELKVVASSKAGKKLALNLRDLVYPSPNHPKEWGRKEILASDIILNLAKEEGFAIGRVEVKKDIKYTKKKPVRQNKRSDWDFMQTLAEKMGAVLWYEKRNSGDYIYLVDEETLVGEAVDLTFFYPLRSASGGYTPPSSDKALEMLTAKVTIDPKAGKKGNMTVSSDPKTGDAVVETEQFSGGEWKDYRLDEAKVRALPSEEREKLISLFMSGQLSWEGDPASGIVGVKNFFREVKPEEKSSREGTPSSITVTKTSGDTATSGIGGKDGESKTEEVQYKTTLNTGEIQKLSPEDRAALQGRIIRGELTEDDKKLYTVETSVKKVEPEQATKPTLVTENKPQQDGQSKAKRRDRGFRIEADIHGDLRIKTKKSYLLEGIGKYSRLYYCYKLEHQWGSEGFKTRITFTK